VDDCGFPVVILDATSSANHIPGAIPITEATSVTRTDGVVNTIAMVPDGATIEGLLQSAGIENKLTTVVITGSNLFSFARVYFDLRYWGYPQRKLKVLRGNNTVWTDAGFPLVTDISPQPIPSDIGVADLRRETELRASLQEMIDVAEGNIDDVLVWDVRTPNEYNGVADQTHGPYLLPGSVPFEGHIKGAVNLDIMELLGPGNATFLDNATIVASLAGIGVEMDKTTYVYGRSGGRAGVMFLILDGFLSQPVKLYDGSWLEWGYLADEAKGGALPADSPWRTDTVARSESITYNQDEGVEVELLSIDDIIDPYAPSANLITLTDNAY
jgi:3-mercaptopyruvate sulfurtransferase SseA